jgi:mediator of RNA polymerase II transcription subunit 7
VPITYSRAEYISSPLHEEEEESDDDDDDDDDDEVAAAAAAEEVLMPSVSSKSPFPSPPEFYKLYKNKCDDAAPPLPPLLPEQGETYETFGATHADPSKLLAPELLVDDPDFPFQKLYTLIPHDDEKKRLLVNAKTEIQKLNREILDRFAALANDLQNAPSRTNERIEEIALLYNNLHHLLNTIRPLQARETVAFILKRQIEEKKQALQTLRESLK